MQQTYEAYRCVPAWVIKLLTEQGNAFVCCKTYGKIENDIKKLFGKKPYKVLRHENGYVIEGKLS